MKIRNGFVSNSSSSSFIIKKGYTYKSIKDIASTMINQVSCDLDEKTKLLEKLENRESNFNGIMFYSCNYDTYIKEFDDYFIIQTCNNEDWNLEDETGSYEILKLYPHLDDGYGDIDETKLDITYWDLERNFDFKTSDVYINCKKCYESFVYILDELQCPRCLTTVDGKDSKYKVIKDRDKKLNRVINEE